MYHALDIERSSYRYLEPNSFICEYPSKYVKGMGASLQLKWLLIKCIYTPHTHHPQTIYTKVSNLLNPYMHMDWRALIHNQTQLDNGRDQTHTCEGHD